MNKLFKSILSITFGLIAASSVLFVGACGGDDKDKDKDKDSGTITYTASTLPDGEVSVAYTASVATATGAEGIKYTMSKGQLPAGITLSAEGGLSGKPTKDGDFSFTVKASAGSQSASADFKLKINKHLSEMTYSGEMLPAARINTAYTASVATATSTGTAEITYSTTTALPAGLTLSSNGTLSGTPTALTDGNLTVAVTATSSDSSPVTVNFLLAVVSADAKVLTYADSELKAARVNSAYTASVATATGAANVKYSLFEGSKLPAGLTLAENGDIKGTPTGDTNTYKFTVLATADGVTGASAQFTLLVKPVQALTEYTFEAENVDLTGIEGAGISGHASGTKVIVKVPNAASNCSNGYCVGWSHRDGFAITFVINSDEAGTAKLSLSLGTEAAPLPVSSEVMTVKVNNRTVNYDCDVYTPQYNQQYIQFNKYVIATSVQLKEGENTITLTIKANEYGNGGAALGFMIDALYLETEAFLTWTPKNTEITNK